MAFDVRAFLQQLFGYRQQQQSVSEPAPEPEDTPHRRMHAGEWMPITIHAKPGEMAYDEDQERLYIRFPDGAVYAYEYVTLAEADSLLDHGDHGGGWTWDHLRLRGTLWGYQKPFKLVSDPGNARIWARTKSGRERHAAIGRSGEVFPGWSPTRSLS